MTREPQVTVSWSVVARSAHRNATAPRLPRAIQRPHLRVALATVLAMSSSADSASRPRLRGRVGLSWWIVVGLGALAAPRVFLHDLDIVSEGTLINAAFVFIPPLVWIAVALWRRVPSPVLTLTAVGLVYGILLALGHQLMWNEAFADNPPQLGGNLEDLDPATQEVVMRGFAVVSSVLTGTGVGLVSGAIAWAIRWVMRRRALRRAPR